jgi:hypothetical protein
MRKYTFIGTEHERLDYSPKEERRPQRGKIYNEDEYIGNNLISYFVNSFFCEEWQEVFEEEKVQLTETEKIVLIDFLNDHFEEFCDFINSGDTCIYENYAKLNEELNANNQAKVIISNLIDKIEKL